ASGIMAGINAVRKIEGNSPLILPHETMIGALSRYISDESVENFQPMGANFGILPTLTEKIKDKKERYAALSNRSLEWFGANIKKEL
ncbi:MAG: methylenetetrahydrofolate--tRNA-(uracil(54)-C(5))-methyltransferase (FADH(2)-oxidizing) TrmFO, partial [Clostridia bacterium]|nr:methylenetetrahydrofolate--tRNA-(uracil(54)-C(5))-methyltransferase (FADH(2)-oxidizing) TrmFO [Clostridia bacterium]